MAFSKEKALETLTFVGKIVSFLSLVMTVVIKTRILLGLKNPSEEWVGEKSNDSEEQDDSQS